MAVCFRLQVAGLFRGMSSLMAGIPLVNAVLFGVYGNTRKLFADQDALSTHFYSGMIAGTYVYMMLRKLKISYYPLKRL